MCVMHLQNDSTCQKRNRPNSLRRLSAACTCLPMASPCHSTCDSRQPTQLAPLPSPANCAAALRAMLTTKTVLTTRHLVR